MKFGILLVSIAWLTSNSQPDTRHELKPYSPGGFTNLAANFSGYSGLPIIITDDNFKSSFASIHWAGGSREVDKIMNQLASDFRPAKPAESFLTQNASDRFSPDSMPLTGPAAIILAFQHKSMHSKVHEFQPSADNKAPWSHAAMWCALALSPSMNSARDRMQLTGACHALSKAINNSGGIVESSETTIARISQELLRSSWAQGAANVEALIKIDNLINKASDIEESVSK